MDQSIITKREDFGNPLGQQVLYLPGLGNTLLTCKKTIPKEYKTTVLLKSNGFTQMTYMNPSFEMSLIKDLDLSNTILVCYSNGGTLASRLLFHFKFKEAIICCPTWISMFNVDNSYILRRINQGPITVPLNARDKEVKIHREIFEGLPKVTFYENSWGHSPKPIKEILTRKLT